ncbi:MAG: SUMF1/EgtB/PvdO family nonheme iron enzyme [Planctomycetes bacterium]|nr:SUMF1/EgtB/PvdO family nonheme iron enzyme [Planctomycetota bacterium]
MKTEKMKKRLFFWITLIVFIYLFIGAQNICHGLEFDVAEPVPGFSPTRWVVFNYVTPDATYMLLQVWDPYWRIKSSTWDPNMQQWTSPQELLTDPPGGFPTGTGIASLSPDGMTMFYGAEGYSGVCRSWWTPNGWTLPPKTDPNLDPLASDTYFNGKFLYTTHFYFDIWSSTYDDVNDKFSPAVPVESINTSEWAEGGPWISRDSTLLVFSSDNNSLGGYGGHDLYSATWDEDLKIWTNITNLGPNVNTPLDESLSCMAEEAGILFFERRDPNTDERQPMQAVVKPEPPCMVSIPGGWFPYQNVSDPNDWIFVDSFLIDKYEVTNQLYCQFLNNADPAGDHWISSMEIDRYGDPGNYYYSVQAGKENYPISYVKLSDAEAFAVWRSNLEGVIYRLPTEQEWEKAAAWDPVEQHYYTYGFHRDSIDCSWSNYLGCIGGPMPVGSYNGSDGRNDAKSYYGCYDMSGNFWEWTSDYFILGGYWEGRSEFCQSAYRYGRMVPSYRSNSIGFRLVSEPPTTYHIDGVNGDNTNDGLTRGTAFATIQRGINVAQRCDTVLVWPGVYNEEIGFWGDAITVKSAADAAVVETNYGYAFSFFSAEGPDTVLSNFVIRNSQYGIYLINGSSPLLRNLTIVNNDFGISAFNGSDPDISNCIFWDNKYGDLFRDPVPLQAKYSCIEEGGEGEGNISIEPGFVDANGGDYHLLSERGRYWPAHDVWVLDKVTSPSVDGGDPNVDPSEERMPNGGRINMGAYGNTAYASMNEWPIKGDVDRNGRFNFVDIAILLNDWLAELGWAQ